MINHDELSWYLWHDGDGGPSRGEWKSATYSEDRKNSRLAAAALLLTATDIATTANGSSDGVLGVLTAALSVAQLIQPTVKVFSGDRPKEAQEGGPVQLLRDLLPLLWIFAPGVLLDALKPELPGSA